MKKSILILSILIVTAAISLPIINRMNRGWNLPELKEFAIKDVSKIDKIIMVNRFGEKVILVKLEDNTWRCNDKFRASIGKIDNLLETMQHIEAKNPVAEKYQDAVVKQLASQGIKVEIFDKKEKLKTYYVGGNTIDETGTYMYLDGSSIPFVVHIPGFVGYVSGRYILNEGDWRDTRIFNSNFNNFKSVSVSYPDSSKYNFNIQLNNGNFELYLGNDQSQKIEANQESLKIYTAQFHKVSAEGILKDVSVGFIDSIKHATPFCSITVKTNTKLTDKLDLYFRPVGTDTKMMFDEHGNEMTTDVDKYYGIVNNGNELIQVQQYVFQHILKKPQQLVK